MRKALSILLLAICAATGHAATTSTVITATITFTNAANLVGTAGETLTISNNFGATVLTWTNALFSPSTQIRVGTNIAQDAQRLLAHLSSYPKAGTRVSGNASTYVSLVGSNNLALRIFLSPTNYAKVDYQTNPVIQLQAVLLPLLGTNATNLATMLADGLRAYSTTPALTNAASSNATVKPLVLGAGGIVGLEGAGNASVSRSSTSAVVTASITPAFDNSRTTNGIWSIGTNVSSDSASYQVDALGQEYLYWTNLTQSLALQVTNIWPASVSNRVIHFFFTGGASDYNVTFSCPNPGGVAFHWGFDSPTNGLTSFTVTQAQASVATLAFWRSNVIAARHQPLR